MTQPTENAAPRAALFGYEPTTAKWVALQVDTNGKVVCTM